MKTRKKSFNEIAEVLPALTKDQGWERQLDLHTIFVDWPELVGAEVMAHSRPLKAERGTLWLEVENSAWLQQLQYQKVELLQCVNRRLKLCRIKDIKMVLPKGRWLPEKKPAPKVQFIAPEDSQLKAFKKQAEFIADETCREALVKFWYLAAACRRVDER